MVLLCIFYFFAEAFNFSFVSSGSILMLAHLKSLPDNSDICIILVLVSRECLFLFVSVEVILVLDVVIDL